MSAYTIGKTSYLVIKKLAIDFGLSKQAARNSGWAAALLLGGSSLAFALNKISGKSIDIFQSAKVTAGVTLASIAIRNLIDRVVKHL